MSRSAGSDYSKLAGIAVTAVFSVVLLVICLSVKLERPDDEPLHPDIEEDEQEITFEEVVDLIAGGSYVEAEFLPPTEEPQLSAGSNVEAAPPLPPEPTQEEIMEKKREQIANAVKFNTSTQTEDEGDGGEAPATVASTDVDISYDLVGFTPGHFVLPHGKSTGVIAIRITVDPEGNIVAADLYRPRTDYDTIKDHEAVANCINAAKKSKFVPKEGMESKTTEGFIYYRF